MSSSLQRSQLQVSSRNRFMARAGSSYLRIATDSRNG